MLSIKDILEVLNDVEEIEVVQTEPQRQLQHQPQQPKHQRFPQPQTLMSAEQTVLQSDLRNGRT